jgi:hypothetical protein
MALVRTLAIVAFMTATVAGAGLQPRQVTVTDFVGTWNIEVMSHQVALVIEAAEANKVTATMMMMGNDVQLEGELIDKTIALKGVKTEGAGQGGHAAPKPGARPITVTMQEDGTIAGEMMTSNGPVKWTGEKLKTRKKG